MSDDPGYVLEDVRRRLLVKDSDLPSSARAVAALLAGAGMYFERGGPVRLILNPQTGELAARPLSRESVVYAVHEVAQPFIQRTRKGVLEDIDVTLPDRVAALYLDMAGAWGLPPLRGIAYAPILASGGDIRSEAGYDPTTGQWCAGIPELIDRVASKPTRKQAEAALLQLRKVVATFPFADAVRHRNAAGVETVDLTNSPAMDESSPLAGLLTAVCRPSLDLAPGLAIRAPSLNGSGTGKGLLARIVCAIAFGRTPSAFTGSGDIQELEKRLGAALMEARPAVFIDNLNGVALQSDLLASILTERSTSMRVLGRSEMVALNPTSFLVLTGNALSLSEDLVRRFLVVELDAQTEDPEGRPFTGDLLAEVHADRANLLAAVLTIWRWAQVRSRQLIQGAPFPGYRQWSAWVRDALVSLGCRDPVARIGALKATDLRREDAAHLFETWYEHHGSQAVRAGDLAPAVRLLIDPHGRGRQFIVSALAGFEGTHVGGYKFSRSKTDAKWSIATYAVTKVLPLV